ncbi:MAG: hypothetical protein IT380_03665 [Myxococcales bacterium]|nr:hypothetical protein [Myxococcales bacterium]
MRRALLVVVGLVLLLGGALTALKLATVNQEKVDFAVIEKHRAAASAQLDRVRRLADAVRAEKPLDADTVTIPLSGVSFVDLSGQPPPTGAFVRADLLTEEGYRDDDDGDDFTFDRSPFWGRCGAWLETGKDPDGKPPKFANVIEEEFQAFEKVRYVGVVRPLELVKPERKDDATFLAGHYRYEVLFYELSDSPRLLGGLRLEGKNDEAVRVKYQEKTRAFDEAEWLRRNLRLRAYEALSRALEKASPNAKLHPPSFFTPDA